MKPDVRERLLFERLPVAASIVDAAGRVVAANAEARRLTRGRSAATCRELWRCGEPESHCPLRAAFDRKRLVRRAKVRQGAGCAIERVAVLSRRPARAVVLTGPATRHFRRLAALRRDARRDALTGLLNRAGFEAVAAAQGDRRRGPAAFLMLDIDGLKQANDRFGHSAGDALIARLSRVLASSVRRRDVVGRLGGDEFGVFCEGARRADMEALIRRINGAIAADNAVHPGEPELSAQIGSARGSGPRRLLLKEAADRSLRRRKAALRRWSIGGLR